MRAAPLPPARVYQYAAHNKGEGFIAFMRRSPSGEPLRDERAYSTARFMRHQRLPLWPRVFSMRASAGSMLPGSLAPTLLIDSPLSRTRTPPAPIYFICGADGLVSCFATAVGYVFATSYAFKNLDGFSGDVTGFGHTIGELFGIVALTVF